MQSSQGAQNWTMTAISPTFDPACNSESNGESQICSPNQPHRIYCCFSLSWVDLGYTNQFCVPEVTSEIFSSCDSLVGDSLEFNQTNRGSLCVWLRKHYCSGHRAGKSGLISQRGESLIGFLELRPEPGVYSRVTVGCPFETGVCSVKSGHLSRYEGQLRNVN